MASELLWSTHLPDAVAFLAIALITAFALVELGHRLIELLSAWDEYRRGRSRR